MTTSKYQRILLKFSGEALAGGKGFGIDPTVLEDVCAEIQSAKDLGIELGLVFGGGNIFRGLAASEQGMDRIKADYMGMLATVINSLALQERFERLGIQTRVLSAITVGRFVEPFDRRLAEEYLKAGRLVILAAGTGNPFFSTDTAAALRASELNADVVLKATKVNGVFSDDPAENPDAEYFPRLKYLDMVKKNLKVMDLTAVTICRDSEIPIIVFDINKPDNLKKVVMGESIGTIIS